MCLCFGDLKIDFINNKPETSDNRNADKNKTAAANAYNQGPTTIVQDAPKPPSIVDGDVIITPYVPQPEVVGVPIGSDQQALIDTNATAPTLPMTNQNAQQSTVNVATPTPVVAAQPGSVLEGLTASDVQYLRSVSDRIGLRPAALNGLLTNPISEYGSPTLRAKAEADAATIRKILASRKQ